MKIVKSNLTACIVSFIFVLIFFPGSSCADPLDNWSTVTTDTDDWFYGTTYGNNTFVTVGAFGKILTSPDGLAWTSRTAPVTNHLYGVGFGGNNTFVAVGTLGTILSSSDNGVTWTVRSTGQTHPVSQNLYGVTYGNSTFVVVGGALHNPHLIK